MKVYFIRCAETRRVKIGLSADPFKRVSKINSDSPYPVELLAVEDGGAERESELHRRFAAIRLHGEWFAASDDLMAHIETLPALLNPKRKVRGFLGSTVSMGQTAKLLGVSLPYLSHIGSGARAVTLEFSLRFYLATGECIGPLVGCEAAELDTLCRFVLAEPFFVGGLNKRAA